MSKLANEIFDILKLCWSFSVAEKQYLKWVIITKKIEHLLGLLFLLIERNLIEIECEI